ncbi:MAG: ABC transporter permease [Candidatus Thiodiazotropha sp. (ex. Lucinoma kazani)]
MIRNTLSLLLIEELIRFRHLLFGLTARSLKTAYTGSAGGASWVYIKPLIIIFAYYFVFDKVLSIRLSSEIGGTSNYSLYLLSGILPWLVFSEAMIEGASCLVRESGLIKKTRFPLELVPARSVLTSSIKIFPFFLLIWPLAVFFAEGSWFSLPYLIAWIAIQLLLTYYFILALSILSAALRDIGILVESVFPMLLFFSPVLYPIESVPSGFHWLLWLNPFTPLADGFHAILLRGEMPAMINVVVLLGWIVLGLLLCHVLLKRSREHIVDWL